MKNIIPDLALGISFIFILTLLALAPLNSYAQKNNGRGGHMHSNRGGGNHLYSNHPRGSYTSRSFHATSYRGGIQRHTEVRQRRPVTFVHHSTYRSGISYRPFPYHWHPYQPYFEWGFGWYPVGSFIAGIAATAIIVGTLHSEAENTNGTEIFYDNGSFYQKYNNQYQVIEAPLGMIVPNIPDKATQCTVDNMEFFYYAGVFYQNVDNGYQVVTAPISAIVFNLPPGANESLINNQTYYVLNGVYFQPITYENSPAFQVVEHP